MTWNYPPCRELNYENDDVGKPWLQTAYLFLFRPLHDKKISSPLNLTVLGVTSPYAVCFRRLRFVCQRRRQDYATTSKANNAAQCHP